MLIYYMYISKVSLSPSHSLYNRLIDFWSKGDTKYNEEISFI